jgi:hypothetical protein
VGSDVVASKVTSTIGRRAFLALARSYYTTLEADGVEPLGTALRGVYGGRGHHHGRYR